MSGFAFGLDFLLDQLKSGSKLKECFRNIVELIVWMPRFLSCLRAVLGSFRAHFTELHVVPQRLLGVILAALAVQYIIDGVRAVLM